MLKTVRAIPCRDGREVFRVALGFLARAIWINAGAPDWAKRGVDSYSTTTLFGIFKVFILSFLQNLSFSKY